MELVNPARSQNGRKHFAQVGAAHMRLDVDAPIDFFMAGADSISQPGSYFL